LAGLAAAAFHVEAEAAGLVAARAGFGHLCEQLAEPEHAVVSGRVRALRAATVQLSRVGIKGKVLP
jgi:hypothetical protein